MRFIHVALLISSAQAHSPYPVIKSLDGKELRSNVNARANLVVDDAWSRLKKYARDQVPLLSSAVPGPGGVGRLPALGFNSWNAYHCDINEKKFLDAAQLMIDLGLKDAGYEYVNIDDCWSEMERDPLTKRLTPDFSRFPDGINGTAKKIHDLGMKIGIYSSAGTKTCAGYPASLEYEDVDAQTWAEWGIDYLKYDNCFVPSEWEDECKWCIVDQDNHLDFTPGPNGTCPADADNWCPEGYDFKKSKNYERYRRMKDAIDKTGRPMLYSLCQWGTANVETWGMDIAQSWRSTGDIESDWPRIKEILNENSFYMNSVDFYGHPDPDMLEVGNLQESATSDAETRSHFALWAAMKSPLLIGTDISKLSSHHLEILRNPILLAFNQDPEYGRPAEPYRWGTNPDWTFDAERPAEYWSGKSQMGTLILVLNTHDGASVRSVFFKDVPGLSEHKQYLITNVWTGGEVGCFSFGFYVQIGAHDTAAVMVGAEC